MKTTRGEFGTTMFFLMGQYGMRAVIPAAEVCHDYFPHLKLINFIRKCDDGSIPLPLMRVEKSTQGARGVHIQDLADYIDRQRAQAKKDAPRYDDGTTEQNVKTASH